MGFREGDRVMQTGTIRKGRDEDGDVYVDWDGSPGLGGYIQETYVRRGMAEGEQWFTWDDIEHLDNLEPGDLETIRVLLTGIHTLRESGNL